MSEIHVLKKIIEVCQDQSVKAGNTKSMDELAQLFAQTVLIISGICSGAISMDKGD